MRRLSTDYYRVISARIRGLDAGSRERRRAIYDEARADLREEIRSANPPWQVFEVANEQRALEQAILDIEVSLLRGEPIPQEAPPDPSRSIPAASPAIAPAQAEPEEAVHSYASYAWTGSTYRTRGTAERTTPTPVPDRTARTAVAGPKPPSAWAALTGDVHTLTAMPARVDTVLSQPQPASGVSNIGSRRRPLVLLLVFSALTVAAIAAVGIVMGPEALMRQFRQVTTSALPKDDSQQRFGKALEITNRGHEFLQKGDHDQALAAYEEAIALDPNNATAINGRAFVHWSRGETDRALAGYTDALRIEPHNPTTLRNRAVAYNRKGDHDRAIGDLNDVIRIQPFDADAWNSRCWARALAGQLESALADCNESLRLRPNDPNTLDSRGLVHFRLGRLDAAIADFNAALKQDQQLAGALYGRGVAKLKRFDRSGSADIAAAKAIMPDVVEVYARYGVR